MTDPPAWPEVDETVLDDCARAFEAASKSVEIQWDAAKTERSELFEGGGIWSGGAAGAASTRLDQRIVELETLKGRLSASAQLFRNSRDSVISAKNEIIDNVNKANQTIIGIQNDPDATADSKLNDIRSTIADTRADNIAAIDDERFKLTGEPLPESLTTANDDTRLLTFGPRQGAGDEPPLAVGPPGSVGPPAAPAPALPPEAPPAVAPPEKGDSAGGPGDQATAADSQASVPGGVSPKPVDVSDPTGQVAPPPPPVPPTASPPPAAGPAPGMPGLPGMPGASSAPSTPSAPSLGSPSSPVSSPSSPSAPATSTPSAPAASAAPTTPAQQLTEFNRAMAESAARAAAQMPPIQPTQPPVPMGPAPTPQPLAPPVLPDAPTAATPPPAASGPTGGTAAPVAPAPGPGAPAAPPMPLGQPATPPPAAPVAPAGPVAPAVPPAAAAAGASTVGAPAPVPVSAARAHREAAAAAATAGALRRRSAGNDPVVFAQRIAAALNVGITDVGFVWLTGLAKDGSIVLANNYGLGYIPDGVNLPEQVTLATADENIPATVRGTWTTYPILALHGWAQHHNTDLRAVIATEDQFKGFDPGAPKIVLRPDDIPENGTMAGRHRLQVIAPDAAVKLAAVSSTGLSDLLPPPQADANAPEDNRAQLWFEVFRPLLSNAPDRAVVQMEAFVTYAEHAQNLALYRAHTAVDPADQRAAIADWIYWQHLSVLMSDAIATEATV
ncbi:hypothetical protein BST47_21395 [Mycolicibacterium tusciae]|uniref:Secretion protein EspK n=2 Tax=Mycolicibacterium tusciae TaxID=75922 RepID=A0A1X0JKB0_9MYCO|nr:hypothetical protein BST47_21395 [Mycolicibacterium tusciae]